MHIYNSNSLVEGDMPIAATTLVQGTRNRSDYRNQKDQAKMEARQKRSEWVTPFIQLIMIIIAEE